MLAVPMDRWRKAQHGDAHTTRGHRRYCLFRLAGKTGIGRILFRCERALAVKEQGSGSDDQRAVRAREGGSQCLNGASIRLCSRRVVREVVDKGRVDHAVRRDRSAAQALEIFQRTAMYVGSRGGKGPGSRLRASQADHLMARGDQFPNNGRTDKTCSTSNENTHHDFSFPSLHDDGQLLIPKLESDVKKTLQPFLHSSSKELRRWLGPPRRLALLR